MAQLASGLALLASGVALLAAPIKGMPQPAKPGTIETATSFGSPDELPVVVIVVPLTDPVPCGCDATNNPPTNSTVVLCTNGTNTCYKIFNLEQPDLVPGRCSSVAGVTCAEVNKDCWIQFGCDVVYEEDCCCNGGDLQITFDNGIWGPTNDTLTVGDEKYYVVAGGADCEDDPVANKKTVEILVRCGTSIAFAKIELLCGRCGA
jgi:hypothetical protein